VAQSKFNGGKTRLCSLNERPFILADKCTSLFLSLRSKPPTILDHRTSYAPAAAGSPRKPGSSANDLNFLSLRSKPPKILFHREPHRS